MVEKTISQEYRDELAFKEAMAHMDWTLLRELDQMEKEYLYKVAKDDDES